MALWAAGRGLAAMVFWPCDRVLGPELCKTKASCKRWQASHGVLALRQGPWTRAVQDAASKLEAGSAERPKSRFGASFQSLQKATFGTLGCWPRARSVLHCHGVLALRQGPSTSCARRQPAARRSKQVGSWQRRTADKVKVCS